MNLLTWALWCLAFWIGLTYLVLLFIGL